MTITFYGDQKLRVRLNSHETIYSIVLRTNIVIDNLLEREKEEKLFPSCKKICQCSQASACVHSPCSLDISNPRQHSHIKIRRLDFQSQMNLRLVPDMICISPRCLQSVRRLKISQEQESFPVSCYLCIPTIVNPSTKFVELMTARWRIQRPKFTGR